MNAFRGLADGSLAVIRLSVGWGVVADGRNSYRGRVGDVQDTAITERLAEHLRSGELLDLAPDLALGSLVDEAVMMSWDGTHSVDADDLRCLLRGRVVTDPDPRGLRLRAARIRGRIDLDNLTTTIQLTLLDCLLDEGITAESAHLPGLSLRRCVLIHPSKPALYADQLHTDSGVSFEGSTIFACTADGAIRMSGARIGGGLNCSGAVIRNPSGPALDGEHLQVTGNVFLRSGFTADGAGELGAVRLVWARIGGQLDCTGATISNLSGPALPAGAVQVAGGALLRTGFTADGAGERGAVRLFGARIGVQLDCSGAVIRNPSGPALHGERLDVDGNVFLRAGFTADGDGPDGAVRLVGAHIGGQLDGSGAVIRNPSGPALDGEHLQVTANVFLRSGFTADGAGELGAVRLAWARIGGQLDCTGATISNLSGPALPAGAVQVAGGALLRTGFTADGAGERGAVRLFGARIGVQLDCSGAVIRNPSGPALHGERLDVDGNVFLRAGFTADGDGPDGAVRLAGAHIGGQLDCSGALVTSRSNQQHRWNLDRLTYTGLPLDPISMGRTGWLELFRTATPAYAAQPYQQLVSVHRAAGHDRDVRQILIAQRQAQLDRGVLTGRERLWARFTGITLGYGYQPWKALLLLLGVVVTSVVLAVTLGAHGALAHPLDPKNPAAATVPCTVTEQVGVGLDVGAPFLDTHARDRCTITNTTRGSVLSYSTWGLQLLAGALAALFIAGFTGIVRRT